MSELIHEDTFAGLQEILNNNERVLVEFGASWCGPCRTFLPHFESFAEQHDDFTCVKVDIEVDPEVVSTYKIQSVPQVMLFENGEYVKHVESRTVIKLNQELS